VLQTDIDLTNRIPSPGRVDYIRNSFVTTIGQMR